LTDYYTFTVKESRLRLDRYLVQKLPDYSRSKIQSYIKLGYVTINGMKCKSSFLLQGDETVKCSFKLEKPDTSIIPEPMDLDVIYEDDGLVVINKPTGLVVHPGNGHRRGTLLHGLVYHYKKLSHKSTIRPGIIHRLDKDTSGVILIAKNDKIHDDIANQFKQREIKKEYCALVWGELEKQGVIEQNIGRNRKNRQIFCTVNSGGRDAKTSYTLNKYLPPLSLLRLYPETGRTHQLRVHLKSIGHPIFGDVAYGGGIKNAKSFHIKYTQRINQLLKAIPRVALHACKLQITHPILGKKMDFEASMPKDMKKALEILANE